MKNFIIVLLIVWMLSLLYTGSGAIELSMALQMILEEALQYHLQCEGK